MAFSLTKSLFNLTKSLYQRKTPIKLNQITQFSTTKIVKNISLPTKGHHDFHEETEKLLNRQVQKELEASIFYLTLSSYFGRTDIALPGCQGYFLGMHQEEHLHGIIFTNILLMRGGVLRLKPIFVVQNNDVQGIKTALEQALCLEECIKEVLIELCQVAEKHHDYHIADLVQSNFIKKQNASICELSRLLNRSKMVQDATGEYLFDQHIYDSFVKGQDKNLMDKFDDPFLDGHNNNVYK